jgi:uncharacterized membrane protein YgcG
MPQYEPPKDLTAAQAVRLYNKGCVGNDTPISLIQMIVDGFLKLTTKTEKKLFFSRTTYILKKTGREPANKEEEAFYKNKIILDGQYNSDIDRLDRRIVSAVHGSMKSFYKTNKVYLFLPTLICFLLLGRDFFENDAMLHVILASGLVAFFIATIQLRTIVEQSILAGVLFSLLSFLIFVLSKGSEVTDYGLFLMPLTLATSSIFSFLMYCPSEKGQRLTEYLEGLRMFLKATKLPKKEALSEASMEKLFPYAMALGLEKEWENKFTKIFGEAVYKKIEKQCPHLSKDFASSFSSNLSKCSTAPSSRSSGIGGSGGGGFSGGGFGGGGGGGR